MKKIILSFLMAIAFLTFSTKSNAQDSKKNVFKVNVLSPFARSVSAFYERAVTDKISAQLGVFYTAIKIEETDNKGFGITPEMRIYLGSKGSPRGLFIAPFLRYQNYDLQVKYLNKTNETLDGKAKLTIFGGGILVGSQWIFGNILSLDLWAGPMYSSSNLDIKQGERENFSPRLLDDLAVRAGVTLGVAF